MKSLFLFWALSTAALAGEQVVALSSQTLAQWTVIGARPADLVQDDRLAVPAGAQAGRTFAAGSALVVKAVSRPAFSTEDSEWPILEVGPLTLTLVQREGSGRLVAIAGEASPVELPWTLPLEGTDPTVEVLLGYDPVTGTGIVSWHGEWKSFDTAPSANPVGVWLTAGSHTAWPVDSLEVLLLSEDEAKGGGGTVAKAAGTADAERLQAAIQRFLNRSGPGDDANETAAKADSSDPTASPRRATLEVFTPPAVRQGRAEAIRAAVQAAGAK